MTALRYGELFAGVSGLGMAIEDVFDAHPAWFAEVDAAPSKVLAYHYPTVPNVGDVTTVDWTADELRVDILAGGFPCQDVSLAGKRRGMKSGTRSGLWAEFARAIDAIRPSWVVIENVRGLLSAGTDSDVEWCPWCLGDTSSEHALRALGAVLGDLVELGFDAEWVSVRASDVGAPHGRFRVFILAWPAANTGYGFGGQAEPGASGGDYAVGGSDRGGSGGGNDSRLTLLPTPAVVMNDGESTESWLARREVVKAKGINGNGMGMPLPIAVSLLPATNWGPYAAAVARWETVINRPAPSPVRYDGKDGKPRLNPELTEWMMGWPEGWVTAPEVGLSRAEQLKACGNGVVTLQAATALRELVSRAVAGTDVRLAG